MAAGAPARGAAGGRWPSAGWLPLLLALAVVSAAAEAPPLEPGEPPMPIRLVDVAGTAGVDLLNLHGDLAKDWIVESNGNGAAAFDFDGDGDLDLALTNGSTLERFRGAGGDPLVALYRNEGGWRFLDVTAGSGLTARGWGTGVCVADADADGWLDLYLTAWGPNRLYRNRGDGTFEEVTEAAGVAEERWSTGCAFGDPDRDGDLDLYVANYVRFDETEISPRGAAGHTCEYFDHPVFCGPAGLEPQADVYFRAVRPMEFEDGTAAAGLAGPRFFGFGALWSDLDGDGWPDLYVANDSRPNLYFANRRDGTFEEEALLAGAALSGTGAPQASMGMDSGDYDGDGDFDVFVTNFSQDHNTLYRNLGQGLFTDATFLSRLGGPSMSYLSWATGFVDLDLDGDLDLFVASGHIFEDVETFDLGSTYAEPNQVFANTGDGRFRDASAELGPDLVTPKSSRGATWGDFDDDGDPDLLVVEINERPTLLRNDGLHDHAWARVALAARGANRDGLGARVALAAAGRTQHREVKSGASYQSHLPYALEFGLGGAERIHRLEIRWPDGGRQAILDLPVRRAYTVRRARELAEAPAPPAGAGAPTSPPAG